MGFGLLFRACVIIGVMTSYSTANPLRLDDVIAANIRENDEKGGNIHGHIVAVNAAHGQDDALKRSAVNSNAVEERIEAVNEGSNQDLFEGDILNDEEEDSANNDKRNIITSNRKWRNKLVSYYIPPEMNNVRQTILAAVAEFKARTCVRFKEVPKSYSGDYIKFSNKGGCASYVGRLGGGQTLKLGRGCHIKGVIMHEMMHAMGIYHEQSRPDRDNYVQILWHNIKEGKSHNFKKYSHGKLDTLSLPYDMESIMHYDRFLFSKNGRAPTIIARGRPWAALGGQLRGTFTDNDAKEINTLFGC